MGMTKKRLNSTQSQKVFFSTQLMTHNDPTRIDSNQLTTQSRFLIFNSNRLSTQKSFQFFIQINSRHKKLSRILIQIDSWPKELSGILIRINHDLMIRISCWLGWRFLGLSTQVLTSYDLFGGCRLKCLRRNWFESAHDSSIISETWIDSIHDSYDFPGIDSESIRDSSAFTRHWFS